MPCENISVGAELDQSAGDHGGVQFGHGGVEGVGDLAAGREGEEGENCEGAGAGWVPGDEVSNRGCGEDEDRLEGVTR